MSRLEQLLVGLGRGSDRAEIITSAIVALMTIFYVYTISSFLKLEVFVLRDRVVYDNPFEQYVIGNYADHIIISVGLLIWLCISLRRTKIRYIVCITYGVLLITALLLGPSLLEIFSVVIFPLIVVLVIYQKLVLVKRKKELVTVNGTLYLDYFSLIFIGISAVSIIVLLEPFTSTNMSNNFLRNYAYEIFVMLSPVSAFLMILLIFSVPLKFIIREILISFPALKTFLPHFSHSRDQDSKDEYNEMSATRKWNSKHSDIIFPTAAREFSSKLGQRRKILFLLPILAFSASLALIPYQPALNQDDRLVGIDTGQYAFWVSRLMESSNDGLDEFLEQLFLVQGVNGDRPLSLFLIFLVVKIVNPANMSHMIDQFSVLLAPLLVLSVYFLTRELTSNYVTALLSAFLTAVSYQFLIGIFAGYYANWIALIIGYFCLGYLFKFLKNPRKPILLIFATLLIATLFAHVYTWAIISLCAGIFLILLLVLRTNYYSRKAIMLLLIALAFIAVIDVSKSLTTDSASGIFRDVQLSGERMGPSEFAQRWDNLVFTIYGALGGILSNSIIILLGLWWVLRSNYRGPVILFLLVCLSIPIIPLFFGDWVIQSRIFYTIPFQIPASLGLSCLLLYKNRKNAGAEKSLNMTGALSAAAICSVLTVAAMTVLSNLYLVLPSLN